MYPAQALAGYRFQGFKDKKSQGFKTTKNFCHMVPAV